MRLNDFPLTTLQGLGRRRLWWSRRPTRATSATSVATNATAVGGQAGRPKGATLSFQLPALPALGLVTRLAVAALGLGLLLGVAGALRGALASRSFASAPAAPAAAPAAAPTAAPAAATLAPGVGANGAWFGPAARPSASEAGRLGAAPRLRPEAGLAYALPGGILPPARLPTAWERQARLYAAAWAGSRDALLPPTLRGRPTVASHSVATRAGVAPAPAAGWKPSGAATSGARARPLPLQARPQWQALRRPSKLQWRL